MIWKNENYGNSGIKENGFDSGKPNNNKSSILPLKTPIEEQVNKMTEQKTEQATEQKATTEESNEKVNVVTQKALDLLNSLTYAKFKKSPLGKVTCDIATKQGLNEETLKQISSSKNKNFVTALIFSNVSVTEENKKEFLKTLNVETATAKQEINDIE